MYRTGVGMNDTEDSFRCFSHWRKSIYKALSETASEELFIISLVICEKFFKEGILFDDVASFEEFFRRYSISYRGSISSDEYANSVEYDGKSRVPLEYKLQCDMAFFSVVSRLSYGEVLYILILLSYILDMLVEECMSPELLESYRFCMKEFFSETEKKNILERRLGERVWDNNKIIKACIQEGMLEEHDLSVWITNALTKEGINKKGITKDALLKQIQYLKNTTGNPLSKKVLTNHLNRRI